MNIKFFLKWTHSSYILTITGLYMGLIYKYLYIYKYINHISFMFYMHTFQVITEGTQGFYGSLGFGYKFVI